MKLPAWLLLSLCIPAAGLHAAKPAKPQPPVLEFRLVATAASAETEELPGSSKGGAQKFLVNKKAVLDQSSLKSAAIRQNAGIPTPSILIELTLEGAGKMASISRENLGKQLAIVVQGKVLTAPVIQSEMNAAVQITGNYTEAEAKAIVAALNAKRAP